jgi:hypothetical protein
MKVVINKSHGQGGFAVRHEVENLYLQKTGKRMSIAPERHDTVLIECIEEIGLVESASYGAELEICELPNGCHYDLFIAPNGSEHIASTWFEIDSETLKQGLSDLELNRIKQVTFIKVI